MSFHLRAPLPPAYLPLLLVSLSNPSLGTRRLQGEPISQAEWQAQIDRQKAEIEAARLRAIEEVRRRILYK